jgi:DNA anti-recombination protein RmuC
MLKLIKITESLFQQAMQVSINGENQDQLGYVVRSCVISPALLALLIRVRQSCWRYTKPELKILET